jgi:hypothetical protein
MVTSLWTPDEYACAYPQVDTMFDTYGPYAPTDMSATDAEQMVNDIARGKYREPRSTPCTVDCHDDPNPSLVNDLHPQALQANQASSVSPATSTAGTDHSIRGSGARRGSDSKIQVIEFLPRSDDPQAPANGCNYDATKKGAWDMASWGLVSIEVHCMTGNKLTAAEWDTTNSYGFGITGPTQDAHVMIDRFNAYVRANQAWSIGYGTSCGTTPPPSECTTATSTSVRTHVNSVAIGWVHQMDHIGIGAPAKWVALAAEHRSGVIDDYARHSVVQHELSHIFLDGAPEEGHYPDNGWMKNYCGVWHWHWEWWGGWWHIHEFSSVMNYCHMFWGYTEYDGDNLATLRGNIQDTAAAP